MKEHALHNEKELLALIGQGDEQAFQQVFDHYWLPLCEAAWKRLQDREQAEDIVQNIFVRLWVRRTSLAIDHLSVYLFTAVRYGVLNYVTRHKTGESFYEPFAALLQETADPETYFLEKELIDLIYAYAETLPAKRRQIFLLHIKDRLSTREIAGELGISQKTVQNQLRSALKGLRTNISKMIVVLISSGL